MNYPDTLPDFKIGKNLSVKSGHAQNDYNNTKLKNEHRTRDEIVMWAVTVLCYGEGLSEDFYSFLVAMGNRPFTKDILTPWGRYDHTVLIVRMPEEPAQIGHNNFEYNFDIMAQRLENDYPCVDRELISRHSLEFAQLDIAINDHWPKYEE